MNIVNLYMCSNSTVLIFIIRTISIIRTRIWTPMAKEVQIIEALLYMLCVYMFRICTLCLHVQTDQIALHRAAERGHTKVVKYLLENTAAQVTAKDDVSH